MQRSVGQERNLKRSDGKATHTPPPSRQSRQSVSGCLGSGCFYVWQTVSVSLQSLSLAVSLAGLSSGCFCVWLSLCRSVRLSVCLPVSLSVCLSVWQSGRGLHFGLFHSTDHGLGRHRKSAERGTESAIMPGTTEDTSAGSIVLINGTHTLLKCM